MGRAESPEMYLYFVADQMRVCEMLPSTLQNIASHFLDGSLTDLLDLNLFPRAVLSGDDLQQPEGRLFGQLTNMAEDSMTDLAGRVCCQRRFCQDEGC